MSRGPPLSLFLPMTSPKAQTFGDGRIMTYERMCQAVFVILYSLQRSPVLRGRWALLSYFANEDAEARGVEWFAQDDPADERQGWARAPGVLAPEMGPASWNA